MSNVGVDRVPSCHAAWQFTLHLSHGMVNGSLDRKGFAIAGAVRVRQPPLHVMNRFCAAAPSQPRAWTWSVAPEQLSPRQHPFKNSGWPHCRLMASENASCGRKVLLSEARTWHLAQKKQCDHPNTMNITMPHTCRMASLCAVLTSPEFRAPWSSEGGGRAG